MNDLDPITTMAINDECLRLYLFNKTPDVIISTLFPGSHKSYTDEKGDALIKNPLRFIANLDMTHRNILYKNAIHTYLDEATQRVLA